MKAIYLIIIATILTILTLILSITSTGFNYESFVGSEKKPKKKEDIKLTAKELNLFNDMKAGKITKDVVNKLIKEGVLTFGLMEKFLNKISLTPDGDGNVVGTPVPTVKLTAATTAAAAQPVAETVAQPATTAAAAQPVAQPATTAAAAQPVAETVAQPITEGFSMRQYAPW